jgi:hypothetical protein
MGAANIAWADGVCEIILGRRPMSHYDSLTQTWARDAGDQVRKEFNDALAAAK